jgi:tetratricopeptide (TPR) repeat protein
MEPSSSASPCLSDEQAIALLEKRVNEATRQEIDAHLDGCDECRELVGALALTGGPETESAPHIDVLDTPGDGSITLLRSSASDARPSDPPSEGAPLHRGDMVDHFRVMRGLGRGAMGEVYLARDTMLGRKVALKIIAPDLLGSEKAVKRFLFEARATARFNHPNIVTIHAVGEHQGRPWVALEYVEGDNLRERARRQRPPLRETLRIGLAIARALGEAHARGVLHRDLKPANVVIGTDGRIRIVDFGLAKAVQATDDDVEAGVHAISSSTWLVGTPRYMAPEQWEGSDVEGSADVWALGVILFELCSGKRPFEAESTVELLRTVCSDQPAPRLATVASVPSKLSQLVASCLAKEPSQRPSAAEVATQLEAILVPNRIAGAASEGPYRGLLPFGEAHAGTFFGREPEVDAFLERMRRQPIIPVVGPSGVGKSSFVQAGVIPRLREQEGWLVLPLRPGPRPFETLAARLERGEGGGAASESAQLPTFATVEARAARLCDQPHLLALELLELARRHESKVLLFIDQLEELFTSVDDPEQQLRFLAALATAADDLDDPVRVVLTLRHDFVDRLAAAGGAASPLARFFALKSPDRRMLEAALREPAERAGYAFEDDDLVEQMIAAVQGEPACLPLLQFAARRLWEERDQDRELLLRSSYEAMGGVGGALARHADAQINALAPSQQRIARSLLRRLVTPERTRRLVPRSEALQGLGTDAESVLNKLTEARLVSVIKLRRGEDPRVELTHGSLIHTWDRLATWVDEGGDDTRLLEEAAQAAELWDKRGRRPEELWRGEALRDAERHLSRSSLPQAVMHFLRASHEAEQQQATRQRWVRMGSTIGLGVVALAAVLASLVFVQRQRADRRARIEAQAQANDMQKRASEASLRAARAAFQAGQPDRAKRELRHALELADSSGARLLYAELEASALRHRGPAPNDCAAAAMHVDGRIALATTSGAVMLVARPGDPPVPLGLAPEAMGAVAFTPDGRSVVVGTTSGRVLRFPAAGGEPKTLGNVVGPVRALAIVDGSLLVQATRANLLPLSGAAAIPLEGAPAIAVGANGALLALDDRGKLWRHHRDGRRDAVIADGPFVRLAASSAGRPVLALGPERIFAITDRQRPVTALPSGAVTTATMAGERAVLHAGNEVHVVATAVDQLVGVLSPPHRGTIMASDGADGLVIAGAGEVTSWDLSRASLPADRVAGATVGLARSEGQGWHSLDASGRLRTWRQHRPIRERWFAMAADAAGAVSPSGVVAIATPAHQIGLWTPERSRLFDAPAQVTALALDDAGGLVSATADGEVQLYDRGAIRHRSSDDVPATVLAYDGHTVALARGESLTTWVPPGRPTPIATDPGPVTALAIRGPRVAAARRGRVDVFAIGEGLEVQLPSGNLVAVAFDGGKHLLGADAAGTVTRWAIGTGRRADPVIVVLPDGSRVTPSGVVATTSAPEGRWLRALRQQGRQASQQATGAPLCVATHHGHLEIWSTGADRLIGDHAIDDLVDVIGLPSGCAATTADSVVLSAGSEPQALKLDSPPRAVGWAEQRLVVVTEQSIVAFAESGERLAEHRPGIADATAVTQVGSTLAVGSEDGSLHWIATADDKSERRAGVIASRVTALAPGPANMLFVGYASGDVALVDRNGAAQWRGRLSGVVSHVHADDDAIVAGTQTGDGERWPMPALKRDRCELLAHLGSSEPCKRTDAAP